MNNPVLFTFTEKPGSGERFAVHLDGSISRPAINFGPSGAWRVESIANAQGAYVTNWAGIITALKECGTVDLKGGRRLMDFDHGSRRLHGATLETLYMARDLPADWFDRAEQLLRDRYARELAERDAAAADRLATARKARNLVCSVDGIEVRRKGSDFFVIDDDTATEALSFEAAAKALGAALIERNS